MDKRVHQKALRSAAKVAIVLGLAGCTASHDERTEVDAAVASDSAVAVVDAAPRIDAGPSEDAGSALCAVAVDPETQLAVADPGAVACCAAHMTGVLERAGDPASPEWSGIRAADLALPSTRECCEGLIRGTAEGPVYSDAVVAAGGVYVEELRFPCCELVHPEDPFSTPGCTPWGPPVPPAVDDELEYLDALA